MGTEYGTVRRVRFPHPEGVAGALAPVEAGGGWDAGVRTLIEPSGPQAPCAHEMPSARDTFWTQSVWLPRYARRGRRAGRLRQGQGAMDVLRMKRRSPSPPAGNALEGALAVSAVLEPCVPAEREVRSPKAVRQPVQVVIGPCASLADIEAVVDDVDRAPGFDVLWRRFGMGSYRCGGYSENPGGLVSWLLARGSVEAATVSEDMIYVTPGGVAG